MRREAREIKRRFGIEERQLTQRNATHRTRTHRPPQQGPGTGGRHRARTTGQNGRSVIRHGGKRRRAESQWYGGSDLPKAEAEAELDYWLAPALDARQQREQATINRRRAKASAELVARHLEAGEDTATLRGQMLRANEIELEWQEKLDELDFERSIETAKLQRARRRAENEFSRDKATITMCLLAKATSAAPADAHAATDAGIFGVMGDPETIALQTKRDEAINARERELAELDAKFAARCADLEAERDDALAEAADA